MLAESSAKPLAGQTENKGLGKKQEISERVRKTSGDFHARLRRFRKHGHQKLTASKLHLEPVANLEVEQPSYRGWDGQATTLPHFDGVGLEHMIATIII